MINIEKYVGDIYIITSINYKLLDYLKKYDIIDDDYLVACTYELAKSNARLFKVGSKYIETSSLRKINLNNKNSDYILSDEIYDPYIGQLFVKNVRKVKELKNTLN